MKKVLLFLLGVSLFFASCKNQSNTEDASKKKDSTLKQLVIKQGGAVAYDFNSPINKTISIDLDKKVSKKNVLLVIAEPNDANAKITFDNGSEASKEKSYEDAPTRVYIKVTNGNVSTLYTLNIREKPLLKSLIVMQKDESLLNSIDPVPFSNRVQLKYDVNAEDYILIKVVPMDVDNEAEILIDSETSPTKEKKYESYKDKILVTLKKGDVKTDYEITLLKSDIPPYEEKDATLEVLVIKQKGVEVARFNRPEHGISYILDKKVSVEDYIEIEAKASDSEATVNIGGDNITNKRYDILNGDISIVCTKDDASEIYTLSLKEPKFPKDNDSTLAHIVIKQKEVVLKDLNSPIPSSMSIKLQKNVSSNEPIIIECTPKVGSSQIFFDTDVVSALNKTYDSFKERVQINVKSATSSTSYLVMFEAPTLSIPEDYTLKCNVIDSMGGTNIPGANIKVFESGTIVQVGEDDTDSAGCVYFTLDADKYYDLVVSKKGSAGSRVEKFYVHENKKEYLPIVMRECAKGAKSIAPEISDIRVGSTPLKDVYEFDNDNNSSIIYATVKSKSAQIIPEIMGDNNNAGFYININSNFSVYDNPIHNPILYGIPVESNGKTINIDAEGVVTQIFKIKMSNLVMQNGENIIYFICYDMAGNRCERHQRVNVKNSKLNADVNATNRFEMFEAYAKRYYRSLHPFGMPSEMGEATSIKVKFSFKFESDRVEIGKVNVLRRPYQEGDIRAGWKVVSSRAYNKGYKGNLTNMFTVYDDSNDLEEGRVYQYKLEAYNSNGKIISPVATLRVMEAFNILLTSPNNRKVVNRSSIKKTNFSFKISDASLWDKDKADYFLFDILVVKDQVYPSGNAFQDGVCFASKMKWRFDKIGDDVLEIGSLNGRELEYKPFKERVGHSQYTIDKLIKYNKGLVTLTYQFMNEADFQYGTKDKLEDNISEAGMYYWDIQDFGKDALVVYAYDDHGACFVKEYPYLNSKTGNELPGNTAKSYSYSNLDATGGAVNGRALFIVKN